MKLPVQQIDDILLMRWQECVRQLNALKNEEQLLRKAIMAIAFEEPKEGVNTFDLGNGYKLKGTAVVNRSIDQALLANMGDQLRAAEIPPEVVKYKPELSLTEYRKLTDEQRHLVDQFLIVKEGSPKLEIVEPKK